MLTASNTSSTHACHSAGVCAPAKEPDQLHGCRFHAGWRRDDGSKSCWRKSWTMSSFGQSLQPSFCVFHSAMTANFSSNFWKWHLVPTSTSSGLIYKALRTVRNFVRPRSSWVTIIGNCGGSDRNGLVFEDVLVFRHASTAATRRSTSITRKEWAKSTTPHHEPSATLWVEGWKFPISHSFMPRRELPSFYWKSDKLYSTGASTIVHTYLTGYIGNPV